MGYLLWRHSKQDGSEYWVGYLGEIPIFRIHWGIIAADPEARNAMTWHLPESREDTKFAEHGGDLMDHAEKVMTLWLIKAGLVLD